MIEYFNLDFIAGICSTPLKILNLWMRLEQVIAHARYIRNLSYNKSPGKNR